MIWKSERKKLHVIEIESHERWREENKLKKKGKRKKRWNKKSKKKKENAE